MLKNAYCSFNCPQLRVVSSLHLMLFTVVFVIVFDSFLLSVHFVFTVQGRDLSSVVA